MSFDSLPNEVLHRIFQRLPLIDRVRLSGVNQRFKEISHKSIVERKNLSFSDDLTTYFASNLPIASYLAESAQHLERINLVVNSKLRLNLTRSILCFEYPKLIQIRISYMRKADRPDVELRHFDRMLSESRRLKSIQLKNCHFRFPDGHFAFESLEILEMGEISIDHLDALINRVPNLKSFTAKIVDESVNNHQLGIFLRSAPKLKSLKLDLHPGITDFADGWTEFDSLKSIVIKQQGLVGALNMIPARFPNLETLLLKTIDISAGDICNAALRLAGLKNVYIFGCSTTTESTSTEFNVLSACINLRKLILADFTVSERSIMRLLRCCPDLRTIGVRDITTREKTKVDHAKQVNRIIDTIVAYRLDRSFKFLFKSLTPDPRRRTAMELWTKPRTRKYAKERGVTIKIAELQDYLF